MSYKVSLNGEALKLLISNGFFNVDKYLYQAIDQGDLNLCTYLLESGANVKWDEITGNTVLHIASSAGNIELMRLLLSYDNDINAQNKSGNTPLHYAEKLHMIQFLIENGADFTIKNNQGQTPKDKIIDYLQSIPCRYEYTDKLQQSIDFLQACEDAPTIKVAEN